MIPESSPYWGSIGAFLGIMEEKMETTITGDILGSSKGVPRFTSPLLPLHCYVESRFGELKVYLILHWIMGHHRQSPP